MQPRGLATAPSPHLIAVKKPGNAPALFDTLPGMSDYTDGQEAAAAGKKRMLQGHVPGEPQEKRRKHDERGANPANASGLDTAPAPYPSAAKKPRKERNWCNECNVCFHGIATRLCASCAKENPKLCQKHNAWVKEDL